MSSAAKRDEGAAATAPPTGPWYVGAEAMAMLGVSPGEFDGLVASGALPKRGQMLRGGRFAYSEIVALRNEREALALKADQERMAREAAALDAVRAAEPAPVSGLELAKREYDAWLLKQNQPQHLYLVEFVGNCVKVGITTRPKNRIATHEADARKFGLEVGRIWVSFAHKEARLNEKIMQFGSRSPTEYLERRFERLVARAQKLTMTRAESAS